MTELRGRLERRAADRAAAIEQRLENVRRKIARRRQYGRVAVAGDLRQA